MRPLEDFTAYVGCHRFSACGLTQNAVAVADGCRRTCWPRVPYPLLYTHNELPTAPPKKPVCVSHFRRFPFECLSCFAWVLSSMGVQKTPSTTEYTYRNRWIAFGCSGCSTRCHGQDRGSQQSRRLFKTTMIRFLCPSSSSKTWPSKARKEFENQPKRKRGVG